MIWVKARNDLISISNKRFFRSSMIISSHTFRIMACNLAIQCALVYGFLKCDLPEDTTDMDLKVHMLKIIHTFRRDYKSQTSWCSPWGIEVQPYPNFEQKMGEFMRRRETTATPYATTPSRSKAQKRPRRNLVLLTPTPDRRRPVKPRKINVLWIQLICKRSPNLSTTINNKHNTIDWNTKAGKELTCEAIEAAQDALTNLAPVQGTQLVTNLPPHPLQLPLQRKLQRRRGRKTVPNIAQYVPLWVKNAMAENIIRFGL